MNNIEIIITWYKNNPVGFWLNDKLIWETNEVILETDLLETKFSLPITEAAKFSMIFMNGINSERLLILLAVVKMECEKLQKLQIENKLNKEKSICDGYCGACSEYNRCNDIHAAEYYDNEEGWEDENESSKNNA